VRTRLNDEVRPQYTYLVPSVAYDPVGKRQLLTRQLQLLELLHKTGEPQYQSHVDRLLARSDVETAFWALDQSPPASRCATVQLLLRAAEERHGDIVALFPGVFRDMRRAEKISSRCPHVEKPEHRLLLGLLLGLPDRAGILEFLRRQYDDDPVELITRWVEEMATTNAADSGELNGLGIHLDESSLFIFRCLLEGLSFAAMKERLQDEYDPADVEAQESELHELFSAMRESVLFRPLFIDADLQLSRSAGVAGVRALLLQRIVRPPSRRFKHFLSDHVTSCEPSRLGTRLQIAVIGKAARPRAGKSSVAGQAHEQNVQFLRGVAACAISRMQTPGSSGQSGALVRAGFGKRLMFGADQMFWPEAIKMAVEGIESAKFLSAEQKRDIFYNNAATFLRLDQKPATPAGAK
jgi:hypothetical protein